MYKHTQMSMQMHMNIFMYIFFYMYMEEQGCVHLLSPPTTLLTSEGGSAVAGGLSGVLGSLLSLPAFVTLAWDGLDAVVVGAAWVGGVGWSIHCENEVNDTITSVGFKLSTTKT